MKKISLGLLLIKMLKVTMLAFGGGPMSVSLYAKEFVEDNATLTGIILFLFDNLECLPPKHWSVLSMKCIGMLNCS